MMTDTPATDPAAEPKDVERKELPLPTDLKTLLLLGIFCLLAFYALYLTGEIMVPIIIAFLLKMVLQPAMEVLVGWRVPRFIAALVLLVVLFAMVSGLASTLAAPAASWLSNAPQGVARLEKRLSALSEMTHNLRQASHDVEKIS